MSIRALCSIHQISVLPQTVTVGKGLSVRRDFSATSRVLNCRVIPATFAEKQDLLITRGFKAMYKVRFPDDPQLTTTSRVQYANSTIMRIVPAYNAHELGRIWTIYTGVYSADQSSESGPPA